MLIGGWDSESIVTKPYQFGFKLSFSIKCMYFLGMVYCYSDYNVEFNNGTNNKELKS